MSLLFKSKAEACFHSNRVFSDRQVSFLDEETRKLVNAGTIRPVQHKPRCVLAMSCVPKKNKKLHLVVNCRPVNNHTDCPSFTQEGILAVSQLIEKDDQLVTVDLKNGNHYVPVAKEYQKYLGIFCRGQYYVWQALPVGVSCAPYFFHKCLQPVVHFLREQNIKVSPFVDNILLMAQR